MWARGECFQLPTGSAAPVNLPHVNGWRWDVPSAGVTEASASTACLMQTIPFSLQRTENESGRSRVCVRAAEILHRLLLPPRRADTKLEPHTLWSTELQWFQWKSFILASGFDISTALSNMFRWSSLDISLCFQRCCLMSVIPPEHCVTWTLGLHYFCSNTPVMSLPVDFC